MKKFICLIVLSSLTIHLHAMGPFAIEVAKGALADLCSNAVLKGIDSFRSTPSKNVPVKNSGMNGIAKNKKQNVVVQDDDTQVLYRAVCGGRMNDIRALLKSSNHINELNLNGRETALMAACRLGKIDVVRLLCGNSRINIHTENISGETALVFAVRADKFAVVKVLVEEFHADVSIKVNSKSLDMLTTVPAIKHYLKGKIQVAANVRSAMNSSQGPSRTHKENRYKRREASSCRYR